MVLTAKGLEFIEVWFGATGRVPPNVTKVYQLLLHTASMGGVVSFQMTLRIGYDREVVEEAVSNGYVDPTPVSRKPEKEVIMRIKEMMRKPLREIYV